VWKNKDWQNHKCMKHEEKALNPIYMKLHPNWHEYNFAPCVPPEEENRIMKFLSPDNPCPLRAKYKLTRSNSTLAGNAEARKVIGSTVKVPTKKFGAQVVQPTSMKQNRGKAVASNNPRQKSPLS